MVQLNPEEIPPLKEDLTSISFGQDEYYLDRMVKDQIERRGIRDPKVLGAMRKVKRHLFVPPFQRDRSYEDGPLPIGEGQTISQPYIVALMTELLALGEGDRVLEIGTGSGYQAAILAEICKEVFTIEIIRPLALTAARRLIDLGYRNITFGVGDGYRGWKENAPFDGIIVTAAPEHIPKALVDQLKVGRHLVIPVGYDFQNLIRLTRTEGGAKEEVITGVRFVPMTGEAEEK